MFCPSHKLVFACLAGLFAVWAGATALGIFGQRKLFYEEGREELYDYWMPRMCLEQGYVGHPERFAGFVDVQNRKPIEISGGDVLLSGWYTDGEKTLFVTGWRDRVYPLFGILPLKPFPATRFGGYLWSVIAGLAFLASLCLISKSWLPLLLACSMPFLFNFERGNTTWLSAAFAGVFLAWWDDEKDWKQFAAAVCLAVAGAIRFFREFSRRIVQLSDGRCVYFTPDERAKKRNADNAVSWAEYAVHAVTNGGKRLPGKTYNERCLNYHKIEGFNLIEQTLRNERCVVRINDDARYDAIMFGGEDVAGRIVNVVTRLDDFGNIDANLTEVTFEASSKRNKKPPRLMPLAEAIGTVVHRQVAAGSNPSIVDSIANSDFRGKGYRTIVSVVEHEWPGLYAPQLNWALENLPIEAEWVMRLDADEYFLPEAIEELKEKLPTLPNDVTGVISKRRHYIFGGWAKHGTYPVKLLRVFRRGKAICEERYMDEHMQLTEGRAVEFDYDFVDHNLNSFEWWKEKHRGYAKREAMDAIEIMQELKSGAHKNIMIDGQAAAKRKKKYQYYRLPPYFRAFVYFCIRYFLKLGFLDGIVGFRWHFWQGLWYRWLVDREIGRIRG